MIAFIGGGLLVFGLRKQECKTWMRVCFIISTLVCLGSSIFFAGREFFGPNGFYWVAHRAWGYLIAFPAMVGFTYLGYLLCKDTQNKNLWIVLLIVLAAFVIALTAGVSLIKVIYHRPRFRAVVNDGLDYYPWYIRCSDYHKLMKEYLVDSEEFKSFPSGHAASAMGFALVPLFLPVVDKKYEKVQLPVFLCGLAFALLVMFSRMLVGAHYLSDVSMGALLTTLLIYIAFEVIRSSKKLTI